MNAGKCVRILTFPSLLVILVVCCAVGESAPQTESSTSVAARSSPAGTVADEKRASEYVGSETCKNCHEEIYDGSEKTPHWKTTLNKLGGPSTQGCEGCHGPGKAHVDGGGDVTKIFTFKNVPTKAIVDRCLSCHAGGTLKYRPRQGTRST